MSALTAAEIVALLLNDRLVDLDHPVPVGLDRSRDVGRRTRADQVGDHDRRGGQHGDDTADHDPENQ